MPKLKVKTGDTVVVIAGKDKGKQGKVLATFPSENKLIVDGVNVAVKHQKPKSAQDKGGKVNVNLKVDVSDVMLVCTSCKKSSRIGYKEVNGEKVRFCKKCGKVIDYKVKEEPKKAATKATAEKQLAELESSVAEAKAATSKPAAKTTAAKPAAKTATTKQNAASAQKVSATKQASKTTATKTANRAGSQGK